MIALQGKIKNKNKEFLTFFQFFLIQTCHSKLQI